MILLYRQYRCQVNNGIYVSAMVISQKKHCTTTIFVNPSIVIPGDPLIRRPVVTKSSLGTTGPGRRASG